MNELPNDINTLRALVLEQNGLVLQQQEAIMALKLELSDQAAEIEQLKRQLAELKRLHFGQSSEKVKRQIGRLEKQINELEEEQIRSQAPSDPGVPTALRQSPARNVNDRLKCPDFDHLKCPVFDRIKSHFLT